MGLIRERLRKEREKKKISLEDVSVHTKIVTRYLKALEEEDFAVFPAEIYLRGCLRNYARYLGLDAEELIQIYDEQYKIKEEVTPPLKKETPIKKLYIFVAIVVLGLVLLLWLGFSLYFRSRFTTQEAVSLPATLPTPIKEIRLTPKPTTLIPAPVILEAVATDDVWVHVTVDDKDIIIETLRPGDTRIWEAQDNIKLWVGNAGGLELKFNGRPLGSIGASGEVRSNLVFFRDRAIL